jgi:hypothetical protein
VVVVGFSPMKGDGAGTGVGFSGGMLVVVGATELTFSVLVFRKAASLNTSTCKNDTYNSGNFYPRLHKFFILKNLSRAQIYS